MNTLERIAQLEKELQELKDLVSLEIPCKENYKPRPGEICVFSVDDDDHCITARFIEFDDTDIYPYVTEDGCKYPYCHPLNDPMVIQLIPHNQDFDEPCNPSDEVVVLFCDSNNYGIGNARDFLWDRVQAYKVLN
jgi:hypothetical protein